MSGADYKTRAIGFGYGPIRAASDPFEVFYERCVIAFESCRGRGYDPVRASIARPAS